MGVVNPGFEVGCNGPEDRRKFLRFIQAAQNAVAGRRVGDVNQPPLANLNLMAAVFPNDAWVISMCTVVLGVNGAMEDRADELATATVGRSGRWCVSDLEGERALQLEAAWQIAGQIEIELRSMLAGLRRGHRTALIELHELPERGFRVHRQAIEKHGEIHGRGFRSRGQALRYKEVAAANGHHEAGRCRKNRSQAQ